MRDLKRPAFMQKAAMGKRGHMAFLEILIAFLVFIVSSFVMGIIQVPLMALYLMSDEKYMGLLFKGDTASFRQAMEIALQVPDWLMIVVLMSEILMIVVVILYCLLLEKRTPDTLGFRKKGMIRQYALGALGGIVFFSVAYLLCLVTGSIHFHGFSDDILPIYIIGYLLGYLVQGMAEEVLCRGYLLVSLTRRYSVSYSIVISAVFFALLHGMNSHLTFLALINLFLFGVLAALMLVRYENIWIVGAFHSLWNFAQGNLYGIQVSGSSLQKSVFASTSKAELSVINGGAFGMEGGLAVTVVMVAGIAYLIWVLQKEGKILEQPAPMPFKGAGQNQADSIPGGNMASGEAHPVPPVKNVTAEERTASTDMESKRRENMGIHPGETPWHPDTARQQTAQEPSQETTAFNADYFKE